ncbi:MAG: NAD(P)H-dependent oxidoreductase, partial [Proteobacteria bacterium]|nr:NAD(P)H-dependent oxidoreductase [Pseudomonadota bacterium]
MRILHINASARGEESQSLRVSKHLIAEIAKRTSVDLDEIDLYDAELPQVGKDAVGAKMAILKRIEATPEQAEAWHSLKQIFDRFSAADVYVINTPLWNGGIPYRLKHYIDIVTQPGWSFKFDLQTGYSGLLQNKRAFVVQASGVYYAGIRPNFGSDHATPYLESWLSFIGVQA